VGVEIQESPVSDDEFDAMQTFVRDYLTASVENEDEGGRMRWYPGTLPSTGSTTS